MHAARLGLNLLMLAALSACGDATPPGGESASPAIPVVSGEPGPSDILAALPAAEQPYGLDVYTAKCLQCHGNLGQGVDDNPPLKGLDPRAMYRKLLDYRAGGIEGEAARPMSDAVKNLDDAELAAVSIYAGE